MLGFYGFKTALNSLLAGDPSGGDFRTFLHPVNCWRHASFRFALDNLDIRRGEEVLDLGSPKLLSLYIAEKLGARVWASDRSDYFITRFRRYRRLRKIPEGCCPFILTDGRRLAFRSQFHKFFSISVVEHIPEDGDRECMRELGRILLPEGRGLITVPFAPRGEIQYRTGDFYWAPERRDTTRRNDRVFYQRVYGEADIQDRLIEPSGLQLIQSRYIGTRVPGEVVNRLSSLPGPIQGLIHRLLITGPSEDWRKLRAPSAAFLLLRQPKSTEDGPGESKLI